MCGPLTNECKHEICTLCLIQMETDVCPYCRVRIKDELRILTRKYRKQQQKRNKKECTQEMIEFLSRSLR